MKIPTIKANLDSFVATMENGQAREQMKIAIYEDKLRSQALDPIAKKHVEKQIARYEKRLLAVSALFAELSESEVAELRKCNIDYDNLLETFLDKYAIKKISQLFRALAHNDAHYLADNKIEKFLRLISNSTEAYVDNDAIVRCATNLRDSSVSTRQAGMCRLMYTRLGLARPVMRGNSIDGIELDLDHIAYKRIQSLFAS